MQGTLKGRPLNVNRAFAQLHGYSSPEEFLAEVTDVGRQLFVDPMQLQQFGESVLRDGAVTGAEVQVYRKDGSTRWASGKNLEVYPTHVEQLSSARVRWRILPTASRPRNA